MILAISPGTAHGQAAPNCNSPRADVLTASIVQATGESLQRKRWQPQGGVIQFTIRSLPSAIPDKASFLVCFRWRLVGDGTASADYRAARPDRVERNNDTWTVTTTIPADFPPAPKDKTVDSALPLVPLADVRILAVKDDKTVAADVSTVIGITHPALALGLAIGAVIIVLIGLNIIAHLRLTHPGIRKASWFLRIISTPGGRASVSQLQIVLWTLVVAASAVYVMALSGDLIEITNGTLVLLGIAGGAAVAAKAHTESQTAAAHAAAADEKKKADEAAIKSAKVAADAAALPAEKTAAADASVDAQKRADAARTRAASLVDPPAAQAPQWSDLIVNEYTQVDGATTREIDVSRFQMLLFTLITAAFVVMNVVTTYVIPEIPTGFLTLMGISNGVYLGAKVAQGSN